MTVLNERRKIYIRWEHDKTDPDKVILRRATGEEVWKDINTEDRALEAMDFYENGMDEQEGQNAAHQQHGNGKHQSSGDI